MKSIPAKATFSAAMLHWVYPASSAAIDDYRHPGILVAPHSEGGVVLVATDGHILSAAYDSTGHSEVPFSFIPTQTTMDLCTADLGSEDEHLANRVCIDGGILTLLQESEHFLDEIHIQPGCCLYHEPFPGYKTLIKSGRNAVAVGTGTFDNRLLARLIAGLPGSATLSGARIRTGRPEDDGSFAIQPHYIEFSDLPYVGVIMPILGDDSDYKNEFAWFIED